MPTTGTTPYYGLTYATPDTAVADFPAVSQQQAEKTEAVLKTANVPPGNPDVTDILLRLAAAETLLVQNSPLALSPPSGTTRIDTMETVGTFYFSGAAAGLVTDKPSGMGTGPFFLTNLPKAGDFAGATHIQTATRYTNEAWTRVTNTDTPATWKKITAV